MINSLLEQFNHNILLEQITTKTIVNVQILFPRTIFINNKNRKEFLFSEKVIHKTTICSYRVSNQSRWKATSDSIIYKFLGPHWQSRHKYGSRAVNSGRECCKTEKLRKKKLKKKWKWKESIEPGRRNWKNWEKLEI